MPVAKALETRDFGIDVDQYYEEDSTPEIDIFEKAVLLVLSMPYGFGTKKKAPDETVQADAEDGWVESYKKTLQSPEFEAIKSADGKLRSYIQGRCLPSLDKLFRSGVYPLPVELIAEVDERLEAHKEIRQRLIDRFLDTYEERCDEAREALGDLYNDSDYPSKDELRLNLNMRYQYITINTPESLKGISDTIFQRECDKAETMWSEARDEMRAALRAQLQELLNHLVDRLRPSADGKAKIFRNSMMSNFGDFLSVFDAKNISDDQELAALVDKLKGLSADVTPENLRANADFRADIATSFEDIKTELDQMIINKPGRSFISCED